MIYIKTAHRGGFMIETIANLLKNKKWDTLIIIALLAILFIAVPAAINYTINKSIDNSLDEHLKPMQEMIESINSDVSELKHKSECELKERAVAAYSKIETVEDLNNNPSNMINIKMGLTDDDTRSLLMTLDKDRTLLFISELFLA